MGADVGRPQVVWGNLLAAIVTLFASLFFFSSLTQHDDSLAVPPGRMGPSARAAGVQLVALPAPHGEVSFPVAHPFGAADVSYKVTRFFMTDLRPPPNEGTAGILVSGFRSESAVLKHLLSSASWALHLCSTASCVAPYLTHIYAAGQQRESGKAKLRVCGLLYGAAAVGHTVARDLRRYGVLVATYKDPTLVEGAMALHGILNQSMKRNVTYAKCSFAINSCQYDETHGSDTTPHDVVPVIPFSGVFFGDMRMDTVPFDVVHIDVSADEALASVTYLNALLAAAVRPSFVSIALYSSPLLNAVVRAADALRTGPIGYHLFLGGGQCLAVAGSSIVSSSDELSAILRRVGAAAPATRTNMRSFAPQPLCVLFLSREYASLSDLLRRVQPVSKAGAFGSFFHNSVPALAVKAAEARAAPDVGGATVLLALLVPSAVAGILLYGATRRGSR